jgi:hypothetical protein
LLALCGAAALALAAFCYGAWREIAARRSGGRISPHW